MGVLLAAEVMAQKRSTMRGKVTSRTPVETEVQLPADTFLIPDSGAVMLYGYDKPLRSRRESVFVTNNSGRDINAISITTLYLDSKGRQFHKISRRIPTDIPAGETRRVEYTSWDTQQSFYYVGSKRSRTSGIPYNVRQSADTVFFRKAGKETSQ